MKELTWTQVVGRRLVRNHLAERAPRDRLAEVVADVCGIHAQVTTEADLSIAARVEGVTRRDVHDALWERRSLVKGWTLRGTLHLHPDWDIPLWMAARRVNAFWSDPDWLGERAIEQGQAEAVIEAIRAALDGRALTREELGDEVERRTGSWAKRDLPWPSFGGRPAPMWGEYLGTAAQTCHGPKKGRHVTFVRADQWVAEWQDLDPNEAVRTALRRYLAAYGPATVKDFVQWFGLKRGAAQRVFDSLGDELEQVDVEGNPATALAGDWDGVDADARSVRLVPRFDCYVIGCHEPGWQRDRLIPAAAGNRVFAGGAGPFPVLLVDGVVAGLWERHVRGRRMQIDVEPFERLSAAQSGELAAEAARVGTILGADVAVSVK